MTTKLHEILLALAILIGVFLAGFYEGRGDRQIETHTVVQTETKTGDTQIVYRDRIVTQVVEKKPDGTVTTTTKTEQVADNIERKTAETDKSSDTSTKTAPVLSNYSLGLAYVSSYSELLDLTKPGWSNLEVTAGRRLLGDTWLTLGVQPVGRGFSLGLSIQF